MAFDPIIPSMRDFQHEGLSHDPIHGYISFTSGRLPDGEVSERQIIDHPWVQRLRQIHQLQTAWWVFPTAEHTRFQHVLGVMHLASRAAVSLYDSLAETCADVPSRGYVEALLRVAGLLHDVGHGPFGHFLDEHFLRDFGLTHETLGRHIITTELGSLVRGIRRTPNHRLAANEELDPQQVAYLVVRPSADPSTAPAPRWLQFLRSLFCGLYTVDNMDFVLRDAYMSGYNTRVFDLERLLHYSFYSSAGLAIHTRGLPALVRFIGVCASFFGQSTSTARFARLILRWPNCSSTARLDFSRKPARASRRLPAFHRMVAAGRRRSLGHEQRSGIASLRCPLGETGCPRSDLEDGGRADHLLAARRGRAGEHLQPRRFLRASLARCVAGEFEIVATARGPGAAYPSARHARPRAGQNFLYDADRDTIRGAR